MRRHDLDEGTQHGAAVDAEIEREHHLDREQLAEGRRRHQPVQCRIGGHQRQAGDRDQHRLAADAIGERAADRIPDEVGHRDEQRDQQRVMRRQLQHGLAEGRRVHGDEVERRRGQDRDHHPENDDAPIGERGGEHLVCGGMLLHGEEGRRLLQRPPQEEDQWNDQASHEEGNAPAPGGHGVGRHHLGEDVAEDRGHEDRDLLARRLERGVEAAIAGRGDLREIHRHAAELDAGREALQQPADQHDDRRRDADGRVARAERDDDRAEGHDAERDDQALAAADAVDIGTQHDGADRSHQGAEPEHAERVEQRGGLVGRGEERLADRGGIEAEQEEVELLEEIAAGCAQDCADSRLDCGRIG